MTQVRYLTIKNELLHSIKAGTLQPGDRIDSEYKLAKQYDVSRLTVQRAVRELVSEGMLRRTQGSGTFVTDFTHRFSLIEVRDVAEEIRLLGGKATSDVLMQRRFQPNDDILNLLELPPESSVFHVCVLQNMDGQPVAYEERFVLCDVYADLLEQDFTKKSVFSYLASRSALEEIENLVSAVHVNEQLAATLKIGADEPCIRIQRRNWYQGECVTYTKITYAGTGQLLGSKYHPYENARMPIAKFADNKSN